MTVAITWTRTINVQKQEMQHVSSLFVQGLRSHLSSQDVILRALGQELVYRGALENPGVGEEYLLRIQQSHGSMMGYALVDVDGEFLVTSQRDLQAPLPNLMTLAREQRDGFDVVVEQGIFQLGRPRFFAPLQEWLISIRSPILNDAGEVIAVMVAGIRLDGGAATWAHMELSDGVEIALVRDDGHLTYLHPMPSTAERRDRLYDTPVSDSLQHIIATQSGFSSYRRPFHLSGNSRPYYLWTEEVPEYELTTVILKDRAEVLSEWGYALLTPLLVWIVSLFVLWFGYQRAARLLNVADTDLRALNKQLRSSLDQYHELTRLIPIGVYQARGLGPTGLDGGELVYLSPRAREILRVSDDIPEREVLGHIEHLVHPDDRADYLRLNLEAAKKLSPFRWKGRLIQKGETRWLEVQSIPSQSADGTPLWNGVIIDETDTKRAEEQINQLVFYDALTQLPNRRLVRERLSNLMLQMASRKQSAALLCIDLDNFKTLNDSLGHESGDKVLKLMAERLQLSVREQDILARLSGDEFLVVLTGLSMSATEAANQARTISSELMQQLDGPFELDNEAYRFTCSVGITLMDSATKDIDMLLQQADQAMYQAKAAGRNTQVFFDEDIQALLASRSEIRRDLHRAITENELELHYQLQVDERCGVRGVEALVRWQHPVRGMISPAEFIPVAEDTGDIIALGDWILTEASEQMVRWHRDSTRRDWTVAVNISVRQLRSPNFVASVLDTLQMTGASPTHLVLEITESMLLTETEDAIAKMAELKSRGVRFSLDDFGTGYSSLSYLNRLPLDKIKIDQSFVQAISLSASGRSLTRTIISLGQSLDLEVTAEGVETEAQLQLLAAQGCDTFQGFWINRPVPEVQIDAMLGHLQETYNAN
ncbi:MAG: EAL domain-containing protein [Idiomarina sp.]|nr:EAL domain-containing protein [Idiomarina sp.]